MKIHYLQHIDFENAANIESWANSNNYSLSSTALYKNEKLPELNSFDLLIILGGTMNIYEEERFPWLKEEKVFIKNAIKKGKFVLGICLGAQLLADALGAKVYKNKYKEIGWYNVNLTDYAANSEFFKGIPKTLEVFQWHGDTFDIPENCIKLASNEICENQAFIYNNRVIGLQFHLEASRSFINNLLENCAGELVKSDYIQSYEYITGYEKINDLEQNFDKFLNNLIQVINREKNNVFCKN